MLVSQPGTFNLQEFTDAGLLLVGGRLYTYAYGTTNQKIAYTDPAGAVPHTYTADGAGGQYIALNARGELPAPLYLTTGSYDIALKRLDGSTVWTRRADPSADSVTALAAPAGAAQVGTSTGATVEARLAAAVTATTAGDGSVPRFAAGPLTPGVSAAISVTKAITTHAYYGFLDNSTVNYAVVGFQAHASFDDGTKHEGVQNSDHHHSFQANSQHNNTGITDRVSGFWAMQYINAGTVTELSQFKAMNPMGAGVITSLYGMYIDDLTRGANNYGVYVVGSRLKSHLAGGITLGLSGEPASVVYDPDTGHLALTPRVTYNIHMKSNVTRFGPVLSETSSIDQNGDGNTYMTPRAGGYKYRFTLESIDIVQAGKGIILHNAAGTISKTVTLSADGLSLVLS